MKLRHDTITFLSDFGLQDEFVGVIHSLLRQGVPDARVIDLAHNIAPFDIKGASLALVRAAEFLCPGVVLALVDPGVGSSRRLIAVEVGDGESILVGPDNGLLAPVVALVGGATRAVVLAQPATSAGSYRAEQALITSVVTRLCEGEDLAAVGTLVDPGELVPGVLAFSEEKNGAIEADVLWVDNFGNVQLNVAHDTLDSWPDKVIIQTTERPISATRVAAFSDLQEHHAGLIRDGSDMVSLVLFQESAAAHFELRAGDSVTLRQNLA